MHPIAIGRIWFSIQLLSPQVVISDALSGLVRTTLRADFHCVTTRWPLGIAWGGVRLSEFFNQRIAPLSTASATIVGVLLRGQDGDRTSLLLEDLMADDVLLVDELNSQPLSVEHGAPLRLIAPRHYGYKSMNCPCLSSGRLCLSSNTAHLPSLIILARALRLKNVVGGFPVGSYATRTDLSSRAQLKSFALARSNTAIAGLNLMRN